MKKVKSYIPWIYQGKEIQNIFDLPENTYGFIYLITNTLTQRKYIGKKALNCYHSVFTKVLNERTGRLNKVKNITSSESNWKDYYGSNSEIKQEIKQFGKEIFLREILLPVFSKRELTFREAEYQFKNNVLDGDIFYNDNILGKFYKGKI